MNARLYFTLLRPVRALFLFGSILFLLIALRISAMSLTDFENNAFAWWALILPLTLGFIFTEAVRSPMHRPFALLLPGFHLRLARWHATFIVTLSLCFTAMACAYDRALPLATIAGVAAALFTISLPLSRSRITSRTALGGLLLIVIMAIVIYFPTALRHWMLSHPWITGASAWIITGLNFARGFARSQSRGSALAPYASLLDAAFAPRTQGERKNAWYSPRPITAGKWTATPTDGSLLSWLRVVRYERTGKDTAAWLKGVLYACGIIVLVALLLTLIFPQSLGEGLYQFIWAQRKAHHNSGLFIMLFMYAGQTAGLLRPSFTYPISRARQAQMVYLDSLLSLAVILAGMTGTFLLVAWLAALWQGWPTPLLGAVKFIMLFAWMVPFMALTQWGGMHMKIRNNMAMSVMCLILGFVPAIIAMTILRHTPRFLVSPGGIALCLLLIGASQYAFYAALRRFYRKGDLLQRGTKRQNVSLV